MLHTGTLYSILAAAWKQEEDTPGLHGVANIKQNTSVELVIAGVVTQGKQPNQA